MQLNPIKPTLKAPGIKLLKLKYDKPLSNFGFKFNLRHCITATDLPAYLASTTVLYQTGVMVGCCKLKPVLKLDSA